MKQINEVKFRAYIGLEMATSLVSYNDIKQYWSEKIFTGHPNFKETMSRDDFLGIRSHITLCPPSSYSHDNASDDPL